MTVQVNIAGTSRGGTSYTTRIIEAVTLAQKKFTDVHIVISKGEHQLGVYEDVTRRLLELNRFLEIRNGRLVSEIKIEAER